jgi:hypothetical protein
MKTETQARWWMVALFAVAMAWVESAVVFYLRTLVNRIVPYQEVPLPVAANLGRTELVREAATLVMLFTVGALAGRNWRARFGFMALAFGIWDIFYYVFLKVMCGWPRSIFDWDVLFLLPMPWWGPVIAPVCIALLLILWGTLASTREQTHPAAPGVWRAWLLNILGAALALYVFMADNLRALGTGADAWRKILPTHFQWPLFCLALCLMTAPIVRALWLPRRAMAMANRQFDSPKEKSPDALTSIKS